MAANRGLCQSGSILSSGNSSGCPIEFCSAFKRKGALDSNIDRIQCASNYTRFFNSIY
jgi:hypothetical protein